MGGFLTLLSGCSTLVVVAPSWAGWSGKPVELGDHQGVTFSAGRQGFA